MSGRRRKMIERAVRADLNKRYARQYLDGLGAGLPAFVKYFVRQAKKAWGRRKQLRRGAAETKRLNALDHKRLRKARAREFDYGKQWQRHHGHTHHTDAERRKTA